MHNIHQVNPHLVTVTKDGAEEALHPCGKHLYRRLADNLLVASIKRQQRLATMSSGSSSFIDTLE